MHDVAIPNSQLILLMADYSCVNLNAFLSLDPEVMVTVDPDSFYGKDIEPFNAFSLVCTATKPAVVVPQIQLSWSRDGVPLDNSVAGLSVTQETINASVVSSTLSLDPARVVDSAMYTCDASINVPDSDTISANNTANVVISGNHLSDYYVGNILLFF